MSSNTVRAHVAFSFKGETYDLATTIDLDQCIGEAGEEPNFHPLLARAHGIDPYSYLYEVLESHEIEFSEPTGIAMHCCGDGQFDWHEFERRWHEESDLQVLREIAARTMGIADLDAHTDLRAALLAAYRAGRAA
jgi:hypothetical protein